jgi:hypothetical protein
VALLGLHNPGRTLLERNGKPALEHIGRFDQVVIDRDDGVTHVPGLGFGEEEVF